MESEKIIQEIRTLNDENQKLKAQLSASRELVTSYSIGIGNRDVVINDLKNTINDLESDFDTAIEEMCGMQHTICKYERDQVSSFDCDHQQQGSQPEDNVKYSSDLCFGCKLKITILNSIIDKQSQEITKQREVIEEITTIEGQGYEIINGLKSELSARKGDSEVLQKVVEAMRPYFSNDVGSASTVSRIANILENYFDVPKQSIDKETVECCKMVDIAAGLQQELDECHDQNKVLSKFFNDGIIWRNESIIKLHSEIDKLETELSTRKGDSEVLLKVVEIVRNEPMAYKSIDELADLLVDYLDAPEPPIDDDTNSGKIFVFLN